MHDSVQNYLYTALGTCASDIFFSHKVDIHHYLYNTQCLLVVLLESPL